VRAPSTSRQRSVSGRVQNEAGRLGACLRIFEECRHPLCETRCAPSPDPRGKRLGYADDPTEREAAHLAVTLAEEAHSNPVYFDNLLWIFCADGYGNVCGSCPKCSICELRNTCRYPTRYHA
jgi:hypothetical protein